MTLPSHNEGFTPVRVEQLSVRFGDVDALREISHVFRSHDCTALVGSSGCGKSTLLRCMVGLVMPTHGAVWLGDVRVHDRVLTRVRHQIGYVIQEGGLFPHLTAEQNVSLLARHLGWNRQRIRDRIAALAEITGLSLDQLQRYPRELSGGQRQRVSIMRALMLDPPILLFDEPFGALDPLIRASMQAELKSMMAELQKTVILVTHDLAEAAFLATQIILMNEGRIVQTGDFTKLRDEPASPFVSQFVQAHRGLVTKPGAAS